MSTVRTRPSPLLDPGPAPSTMGPPPGAPRVAYLVSRYPRLTETFVARELAAVVRAGVDAHLHPLHRERGAVVQPSERALAARVRYESLLSAPVVGSQWSALRRQPGAYLRTLGALVRGNLGSRRLLVGALAAFPLAVHLAERFRAERVQHVHAHFATHPAAAAYVIHRLSGIPFSFTAHGSDIHRDQHMLAEKVQAAAFVVAVSDSNREVVLQACGQAGIAVPADRVVTIRCGVDAVEFPRREPRHRTPSDPLRAVVIGTLHEVKGQTHLVEACRRARDEGTDVHLTLVGDGPDRADLVAQVVAGGLGGAVSFTGAVAQPRVRQLLASADVLVAPSVPSADGRREGLPVVIVEAMAVGVPVIASRLSGIPEIVRHEDTGLLVEPGDAEGLAAALTRIARQPAVAAAWADRAHELVADEFDNDRSARELARRFAGGAP
ncbi:MAG TPA: glycosyltransferase family 4 protein [Acidimicrobiales bacterium]|nr:glycosyltransferase family 4 protein [Acidimicrobiales bacterium]